MGGGEMKGKKLGDTQTKSHVSKQHKVVWRNFGVGYQIYNIMGLGLYWKSWKF